MFFLPLIVACIHVAFASPSVIRLLGMLNMIDPAAYIRTALVCIVVFVLFYCVVYLLTAKVYMKIVNQPD